MTFVKGLNSPYKYDDKRNFSIDEVKKTIEILKKG
jgi:hypothetical protein